MIKTQILIVGAGPGGMAIAGRLRQAGIDFLQIEAADSVGSTWRNHYDRLHLHSVNKWSHLPGLPFPEDFPQYVPKDRLIDYFDQYVEHFDIRPRFGLRLTQLVPNEDTSWTAHIQGGDDIQADHVVIATGVNRIANRPNWPGQQTFTGTIIHSIDYKNPQPFLGQRTLVVGMGNTGAEVALDLAEHEVPTWLSVRGEVSIVPRDLHGRPVQTSARLMAKLPFGIGEWLGNIVRKHYFGDLKPYGLKSSPRPPAAILRETGKTPIIDIGTVDAIKAGKIIVRPGIQAFDEGEIIFTDGQRLAIDKVILATGYRARLGEFIPRIEEFLNDQHLPKGPIGKGFHQGLYFVGFDNYKLGGILGTIFDDSETIVDKISERVGKIEA